MTKGAAVSKPETRRGRPPGRTAYQEQKRRESRKAILDAAVEIFSSTQYINATIDDIIRTAQVSRATFYGHFESKLALAIQIYDGIVADWQNHFDKLADKDTLQPGRLEQWIEALAQLYIAHGYVTPLVEQLVIFEDNFRLRLDRDRDAVIDRLARTGLQGFACAMGPGHDALLQRTRIRLLLHRLDQVCGMISRPGHVSAQDKAAYIEVLADELRQLLAQEAAARE
ncbi:hypothetical protein MB02_02800 [Croceicoccus estronivorus]|uniref:TetR/AcrR family transcriptional regulator n=1 Tax=Croceicoccus estronivorus TaxID=1172626 RepID=UPI000837A603|nr:TetR/AcrR family transcriptional regulator [Croceicoccus estronivorus]OCC25578.1 hypothetical protein MB02_02800 [Croceicoccus estronivorus]